MSQQQQVEKRRHQPLTLPQPSDLAAAIGRDWREPKKLQLAFDSWVKQQHPVIEVLSASIAGSGQVRSTIGQGWQRAREQARGARETETQCDGDGDGCLLSIPLPLLVFWTLVTAFAALLFTTSMSDERRACFTHLGQTYRRMNEGQGRRERGQREFHGDDGIRFSSSSSHSSQPRHLSLSPSLSTPNLKTRQGAFLGGVMGALTKASGDPSATLAGGAAAAGGSGGAEMAKQMAALQAGGPLVQARNFAVMTGVNAGIAAACRRARCGAEDVYSTMVAAFGSGAAFSLVSGMGASQAAAGAAAGTAAAAAGTANPLQAVFTTGCFFALFQGAFYKIGGVFSGGNKGGKGGNLLFEGPEAYARATYMLQTLDLAKFEKNIKRAQLSDATLLLWTEASLAEAKVPPGPRLLILNHLDHYRKNLMKPGSLAPGQMPPPPPPVLK